MLDDITKCLVCDSDNLKKLKYHTKCLNCDSVMGVKNGKTWYEYTIPVDEKINRVKTNRIPKLKGDG